MKCSAILVRHSPAEIHRPAAFRAAGARCLLVDVDRAKIARYGINVDDINSLVADCRPGRLALRQIDDYLIERPSSTVLVRVKGDSMQDAGILDGDLVVVEKRAAAQKGEIVVAIVDNQFTLKRLDVEAGQFVLKPENKAYPTIRPEGALEIFGVMIGLVRKL